MGGHVLQGVEMGTQRVCSQHQSGIAGARDGQMYNQDECKLCQNGKERQSEPGPELAGVQLVLQAVDLERQG